MASLREVSFLLLIGLHSAHAEQPKPRITVKVYDGVNLESSELIRAEREASIVFHEAGIQLIWEVLLAKNVNDHLVTGPDRATLQLRIWTRKMAGKRPSGPDSMGFCLSLENGDAVVLADAVRQRVAIGRTSFAGHLGLAMAHELGHLLLRSAAHSNIGIMRAKWILRDLQEAERGYLRFTAREAELMQNDVRRRMSLKSAYSRDQD